MSVILAEHEIVENKILLHKCIKFRDRARDRARTRFFFFKYLSSYERSDIGLDLIGLDIKLLLYLIKLF